MHDILSSGRMGAVKKGNKKRKRGVKTESRKKVESPSQEEIVKDRAECQEGRDPQ